MLEKPRVIWLLIILMTCIAGCGSDTEKQSTSSPRDPPGTSTGAPQAQPSGAISVTATSKFPTGLPETEIEITNKGPEGVRFKYLMTTFYADGKMSFATIHSVQQTGDVSVAYIFPGTGGTPPPDSGYSFKVPGGQTLSFTSQVRNHNFEVSKQRYIEVALADGQQTVSGPFKIDLPNPLAEVPAR